MYIHILFTFEERREARFGRRIFEASVRVTAEQKLFSPLLLLPSSPPWNERSSDANIDIKGRQIRRLLLLRYLLLHPRKRNSSVIAPQIPVNKYFCIGIRLPLYLASVLSYLSPSRVRRRRTLIPRRVVSRRAPQRDLSARLSIGARWKRGLTSSSSLYDSS